MKFLFLFSYIFRFIGICATIRTRQEIHCLLNAGIFVCAYLLSLNGFSAMRNMSSYSNKTKQKLVFYKLTAIHEVADIESDRLLGPNCAAGATGPRLRLRKLEHFHKNLC